MGKGPHELNPLESAAGRKLRMGSHQRVSSGPCISGKPVLLGNILLFMAYFKNRSFHIRFSFIAFCFLCGFVELKNPSKGRQSFCCIL